MFAVVVKTSEIDYAVSAGVKQADPFGIDPTKVIDLPFSAILSLRMPVFTLGEILILGEDGREVVGAGRKPSKWGVRTEEYDDLNQAIIAAKMTQE